MWPVVGIKSSPNIPKRCPKNSHWSYYLKVMLLILVHTIHHKFWQLYNVNLSPRIFKNRPIWSHWLPIQLNRVCWYNEWYFCLGNKFARKSFRDRKLAQGLRPPKTIRKKLSFYHPVPSWFYKTFFGGNLDFPKINKWKKVCSDV